MTDTKVQVRTEYHPVVLHTHPMLDLDEEQFFRFCQQNKDLRIERTAEGDLEVMPPAGWETGHRNLKLAVQLGTWAEQDNTGIATDSSGGFRLPNGAVRATDAAWVRRERLAGLTPEQKQRFLPLCPDFVIELRSPTDSLTLVQAKMREYIENGARLGWLIDPEERKVHVYQPNDRVEISDKPDSG
jgi:Uma2 family endonuclease